MHVHVHGLDLAHLTFMPAFALALAVQHQGDAFFFPLFLFSFLLMLT